MSKLIDFIRYGKFDQLSLGLDKKFVKNLIYDTFDKLFLGDGLELWSFGYGLELYFENFALVKISIKFDSTRGTFVLPKITGVDRAKFDWYKNLDGLITELDANEIEWEIYKNYSDDTTLCLMCNDSTYIFYSLSDHELISIQSF